MSRWSRRINLSWWTIMVDQVKPYLQKYKNKMFNDQFLFLNDWWGKWKVRLWCLWQHANIKTNSTFFFICSHISKMSHTKTKCNLQFHSLFTHQGTNHGEYQCKVWASRSGCWWLKPPGTLHDVDCQTVANVSKNHSAFIFSLLGWRPHGPKRCQQLLTRWHRITFHKTWIFKNIFVNTNLMDNSFFMNVYFYSLHVSGSHVVVSHTRGSWVPTRVEMTN